MLEQHQQEIKQEVRNYIEDTIQSNKFVLFMKGTPNAPECGFSNVAVQILLHHKIDFVGVNVLENDELREGIKIFSSWPTIPQLYANAQFIGGQIYSPLYIKKK